MRRSASVRGWTLTVCDGLPNGVPTADNDAGWRSSFAKLGALVDAAG